MRKLVVSVILLAAGAAAGIVGWELYQSTSGLPIYVLLNDRDGLDSGDSVIWREFRIGRVVDIDLDPGDRIRVTLRISPDYLEKLPSDTTFMVTSSGLIDKEHALEAHVLNPDSPPFREGDTVEGVSSTLELTLRKARGLLGANDGKADRLFDRMRSKATELRQGLEQVDWNEIESDTATRWQAMSERLSKLSEQQRDEARKAYAELEPQLRQLMGELEELGQSEEAKRLRRRLEKLWPEEAPPSEPRR